MAFKDRLKKLRKEQGLVQRDIANVAEVSVQAVSGWESGENVPELKRLRAIARRLGTTVDDLLEGEPADIRSEDVSAELDKPPGRMLRVKGYVGAGGEAHYYAVAQGDLGEIRARPNDPPQAAAVEILGASLGKFFDRWYAVYNDVRMPVTEDLIGKLCVVGLDDDRILIKKIERNGKNFDLISNSEAEKPIRNVNIVWAAQVIDVRPKYGP